MKPADFNLDSFKEWLDKQPSDRVFEMSNSFRCAGTSFCKEHLKLANVEVLITEMYLDGVYFKLPQWFTDMYEQTMGYGTTAQTLRNILSVRNGVGYLI